MTNGDKIRLMTDEELVMALDTDCNRCAKSENCELCGDPVSYGICVKGNIEWLRQEESEAYSAKIAEAMKSLHENCKKLSCSECPASIQTAVGYRCSLTEYTPDHWEVHV